MKVTKYEIDMLNVKAADAFLIHFFNDENNYEYVVLIDGVKTLMNYLRVRIRKHIHINQTTTRKLQRRRLS